MRNLLALLFLSFSLSSHSQSLVDSIQVTLTSYCGSLEAVVTGWYNGSDPAYLGHAVWGGFLPYGDQGEEIQPGHFEADLFVDNWVGWFPLEGTGYCGSLTITCLEELGLVLTSGPDWWWYCPEESPSEVLWNFDYSGIVLGTQLGLDENGNPIDLTTTEPEPPCGPGTAWDPSLELCVTDNSFPLAPCGAGTVWDPLNEECIIAVPTDNDLDGCVSASDVLNLLSTFGTCPPIPEWPEEPTDTSWACGDSLEYWGHWYSTVEIGGECWFAENLHAEHYRTGAPIPDLILPSVWDTLSSGALSHFDSPELDLQLGRLYNWHAVNDPRGLCPSGWSVPSYDDAGLLGQVARGLAVAGIALKASTDDGYGWNGNNTFGFSALPGGVRGGPGIGDLGQRGFIWLRDDHQPNYTWAMNLWSGQDNLHLGNDWKQLGYSVRCIRD